MSTKTLSQDDLNRALARQKREHAAELEQMRAQLAAVTTLADAAKSRVAELEGALATAQHERTELEQRHGEAIATRQRASAESQWVSALTAARVVPTALPDVLNILGATAQVEQDDGGRIVAVTLDGTRHTDIAVAAKEFLKVRLHYLQPPIGGSGAPRIPGAFPPPPPPDISKMSPAALAEQGWKQDPRSAQ